MIIEIKTFKDTINPQNMVICLYLTQKNLPAPLLPLLPCSLLPVTFRSTEPS